MKIGKSVLIVLIFLITISYLEADSSIPSGGGFLGYVTTITVDTTTSKEYNSQKIDNSWTRYVFNDKDDSKILDFKSTFPCQLDSMKGLEDDCLYQSKTTYTKGAVWKDSSFIETINPLKASTTTENNIGVDLETTDIFVTWIYSDSDTTHSLSFKHDDDLAIYVANIGKISSTTSTTDPTQIANQALQTLLSIGTVQQITYQKIICSLKMPYCQKTTTSTHIDDPSDSSTSTITLKKGWNAIVVVTDNDEGTNHYLYYYSQATPLSKVSGLYQFSNIDQAIKVEVCTDNLDNDGDGKIDCKDPDCDKSLGPSGVSCQYGTETTCDDQIDND